MTPVEFTAATAAAAAAVAAAAAAAPSALGPASVATAGEESGRSTPGMMVTKPSSDESSGVGLGLGGGPGNGLGERVAGFSDGVRVVEGFCKSEERTTVALGLGEAAAAVGAARDSAVSVGAFAVTAERQCGKTESESGI
mgnify:CR=1 FL=1